MSIEVSCPECEVTERVNDNLAGRRVRCRHCDAVIQVPEAEVADPIDPTDWTEPTDQSDPSDQTELEKFTASLATLTDDEPPLELEPEFHAAQLTDSTLGSLKLGQPHDHQVVVLDDEEDNDPVLTPAKRPEEELDMTPMVDVTFLLLIFFMVTAAFSLQKSIEVPRQETDAPSVNVEEETEDTDMVEVQVDECWHRSGSGKRRANKT